jgi:hypothetical protein
MIALASAADSGAWRKPLEVRLLPVGRRIDDHDREPLGGEKLPGLDTRKLPFPQASAPLRRDRRAAVSAA